MTVRVRRRVANVALAAILVATAGVGTQMVSTRDARGTTLPVLVGVHLADPDNSAAGQAAWKESLSQLELTTGRRLDLVATKPETFSSTFPSFVETWAQLTAHVPLVNWLIGYTPGVANGNLDSTIVARAKAMKAYGGRIVLAYAPGMDAGTGGNVTDAASFVAAWRHTHNLFVNRNITNVEWAWCPSLAAWDAGTEMQWYPGAAYVDWSCTQGLAVGAGAPSFGTLFGRFLTAAPSIGKPLMIGSFGADLGNDTDDATWITDAFSNIESSSPAMGAAVYEDSGATAITTGAVSSAWNNAVTDPSLYSAPPRPLFPAAPIAPPTGTLLGALLQQTTKGTEQSAWSTLESESGRPLDVAHTIYKWGLTVPTWRESWHLANGRIPMISWGGDTTSAIVDGSQDAYIRTVAKGLKNLGGPVLLRWFWEMDGNNFAPLAGDPATFKAAWIHIHNIFASVGATNVEFVWSPTAWGFVSGHAQLFYPGAQYVDWIAADGFNSAPLLGGQPSSFVTIFSPFYTWASAQGKPLMVAATGSVEGATPSVKSAWITRIARANQKLFPAIQAIVYFNTPAPLYSDPDHIYDWRVESSPTSLSAWDYVATQPYFRHNDSGTRPT